MIKARLIDYKYNPTCNKVGFIFMSIYLIKADITFKNDVI